MGEVTDEKLEVLRYADAVVCEEVENHAIKDVLWQYFAVLTDTKSTGVKGDERAYGWTLAIRMVESIDAMTANFTKTPWDLLEKISKITGSVAVTFCSLWIISSDFTKTALLSAANRTE